MCFIHSGTRSPHSVLDSRLSQSFARPRANWWIRWLGDRCTVSPGCRLRSRGHQRTGLQEPLTKASCCTWFRNTGDNSSSKKALHSHVILTELPVSLVTISSRRCPRCNLCKSDSPLRDLAVGDIFQDRRQPGHQHATAQGSPTIHQPLQNSQPVPPGDPLDDSPLPNCPIWDVVLTEREKQLLARTLPPQWLSLAEKSLATPQRGQKALREPLVVTSSGVCCAVIVAGGLVGKNIDNCFQLKSYELSKLSVVHEWYTVVRRSRGSAK